MAKPVKMPNGKYRIRWINEAGQRESMVLATKADAEFKLLERQSISEKIRRGLAPKSIDKLGFNQLCDYWLEHRTSQKRSPKDDLSIINAHLKPFFGSMTIDQIGSAECDRYKAGKVKLSLKTVANHLTLLISMLNLAVDLGRLEKAPRIKKPKTNLFSNEFKYLRTNEEIEKLLQAALELSQDHHDLYLLATFTGLRKGEIAGLRWSDVNLKTRLLTIQKSFASTTKSGAVRYVPILDQTYKMLQDRRLRVQSNFVFHNDKGEMMETWHRIFEEDLHLMLRSAGFPEAQFPSGKADRYIVFHSLRHTFASHWVMNGGDIFKLQKILGHSSIQMTMRYAHLAPHAFADDLDRFGGIGVASEMGRVVIMRGS